MSRRIFALFPAAVLSLLAPAIFAQSTTPPAATPTSTQRPATAAPAKSTTGGTTGATHTASEASAGHFYAKSPLSISQEEIFLQRANIVGKKALDTGITKTARYTLTDGRVTHDAHWQTIDVYKPVFKGANGTVEKDFRDSYKYNIAAYRVAKLLHIEEMVPPSVPRTIDGVSGAMTWWGDNVEMSEKERRDRKVAVPTDQTWVNQLNTVRIFDQLIANIDRTQENLLITKDWKVIMIDHTRSFRLSPIPPRPDALTRCDFRLLQTLRRLKRADVQTAVGTWLTPAEVNAVMARRDYIVKFFDTEISKKGDFSVLTGLPRSTPNVTIP